LRDPFPSPSGGGQGGGRRAVVTGGAGFLGSHLCERLLADGWQVTCVDNLVTGAAENIAHLSRNASFEFIQHNVSEPLYLEGAVDAVLHFASPASPVDYADHPIATMKVGTLGTHNMLGLARAKRALFFLASTSEVYGDPSVHPQPETYWGNVNPIGPRSIYDESKRAAEAFTMAYHRTHGMSTRIVRIFNSILADEQILYDDGKELRREPVESLAQRLNGTTDLVGYRVPAFCSDGTVESAAASALVGHPTTATCFEVRTRYGRSVRVTGHHSVFVEGRGGVPKPLPVDQLQVGDRVAIAARIQVPERDRGDVDMVEVWDRAGLDPWNLLIRHPSLEKVVYERRFELFGAIASRNVQTAPRWRSFVWGEIARHRARGQCPLGAMRMLGIAIPDGARVRLRTPGKASELPRKIVLTEQLLWLFGLYLAEGSRYQSLDDAFITISCDRNLLDRAASVIGDLGLHVVSALPSAARSAAIFVHSKLLLLLLDHLGFSSGPKRLPGWTLGLPLPRLKWVLEGYREGDGVHSGKKFADAKRHEFSTISAALKDDLIVAFARFGLFPAVGMYSTTFRQRTGDRRYPFWRLTLCKVKPWSPLEWDRGVSQELNARRLGDLVWAQVTSIAEVPATPRVYDFCVPGHENFWAGTGVMVHNTFGPRMRLNDGRAVPNFLIQALNNEPITVYGNGSQTRSLCYVDDLIDGINRLLVTDYSDPVNIGSENEVTMLQLATRIRDLSGSASEIVFKTLPEDDPKQRRPDLTRARQVLGWEPTTSLDAGLNKTIAYFRQRLAILKK
jgi:UDP-glucuronate decarboxylase